MFGREGRKEKRQREADNAAYEAARKEASEIGLNGSVEAFGQAYERYRGLGEAVNNLLKGAAQAFLEQGHPEKIQFALSERDKFYYRFKAAKVLLPLTKDKDREQAVANVKLALEKLPEDEKQAALDSALSGHIASGTAGKVYSPNRRIFDKNDEAFVDVLLQAGANANGDEGRVFAEAIAYHSPAIVKLLRASGAKFEDALLIMRVEEWEDNYDCEQCITKLNAYQDHENGDTIAQMQQNLADITRVLEDNGLLPSKPKSLKIRPVPPSA